MKRYVQCICIALIVLLCNKTYAQTLFDDFGNFGLASTQVNNQNFGQCSLIDTLSDHSIIEYGYIMTSQGANTYNNVLVKYTDAGFKDNSFGANGVFTIPSSLTLFQSGSVKYIKSQPDGKILVAGDYQPGLSNTQNFFIIRVKANGSSVDSTFGMNGVDTLDTYTQSDNFAGAALQPDGKILVMGACDSFYFKEGFGTIRVNPNGSIDSSFGVNGIAFTNVGEYYNTARALVLQPDGKIIAAGHGDKNPSVSLDFVAVRYLPDGKLDTSFNHTGIKYANNNAPGYGVLKTMILQPDGKLLLTGTDGFSTGSYLLVRLKADGSKDTSFNHTGETTIYTDGNAYITRMAIRTDGKIIIASTYNTGKQHFEVVRLFSNGKIDSNYATNGRARINMNLTTGDYFGDMKLQYDDKILLCGSSGFTTGDATRVLFRLKKDFSVGVTEEKLQQHTATIYPNPAQNNFYITPATGQIISSVDVIDITGRKVKSFLKPSSMKFQVEDLPSGNYVVNVYSEGNQVYAAKLVVRKD